VGFLAYSPLAKGLLSGAYGPDRALDQSDFRSEMKIFSTRSRTSIAAAMRDVVFPIATRRGAKPGQVALAWALARPGVSAVIAGASNELQAQQNAEAARILLEKFELDELDAAFARVRKSFRDTRRVRVWTRAKRAMRGLFGQAVGDF
jgi:aryl-alcohol dehydrogenase-like predicted oxidoreductase